MRKYTQKISTEILGEKELFYIVQERGGQTNVQQKSWLKVI